ncbi:MAG: alpha/beta fold hydrolase [Bacteroidota bacterium]
MRRLNIFLIVSVVFNTLFAQELARRAIWEAKFDRSELRQHPGVEVTLVEPDGPLAQAGLEAGDLLLKVDDRLIDSSEAWDDITYSIRGNKQTNLQIKRDGELKNINVRLNELPMETHTNIRTLYETVTSNYGITQRVITTIPDKKQSKQPAILLLQGLSCSTIELFPGRSSNWGKVINAIVEDSDMVVMRVDKPGVGDSEGDCSQTDFLTELAGYRAAIEHLMAQEYIDTDRIVVVGSSMGSALAPLIANEYKLAGVISDGVFFKTWYEHMLEIERRIRQMSGDNEATIAEKMNNYYIPLYYGMHIQKKTYGEVADAYPALATYNYHGPEHMYGRPVSYYQQLQDFPLAAEWEKLKVPVRIMRGTNDWIMSDEDNDLIIDVLERSGHTDHELYRYPGLDHWATIHRSAKDSFEGKPGEWDPKMVAIMIQWAQDMVD